jgi:hypothetical protein
MTEAPAPTTTTEAPASETTEAKATQVTEPAKAQAEAVKQEIRKLKLKLDGAETELPEDEVIRLAQQAKAGQKRFAEAHAIRQQAEEFIRRLKSDPASALADPNIGIDVKEFARQVVWDEIQEQTLTPEQKQARAEKAELERYKKDAEERKAWEAEQQMLAVKKRYASEYDATITKALENSGLPKTEESVKKLANLLFHAADKGYDLTPEELAEEVKGSIVRDYQTLFSAMTPEQLIKTFGEDFFKKLREFDLRRLKSTTGKVYNETKTEASSKPKVAPKKLKGYDWRESLIREAMGK